MNVGQVKLILHRPLDGTPKTATIRRSRTDNENTLLTERYARMSRNQGQSHLGTQFQERSRLQWRRAERLRQIIEEGEGAVPVDNAASQEHD